MNQYLLYAQSLCDSVLGDAEAVHGEYLEVKVQLGGKRGTFVAPFDSGEASRSAEKVKTEGTMTYFLFTR